METKIFTDEGLDEELREQVFAFESVCFGESKEKIKSDYAEIHCSPTFRHILGFQNGMIVSYLRIVVREISWRGQEIKLGGIGAVCTSPDLRGQGLASALVGQAMGVLQERNVDFALLQTDVNKATRLYGRFGFCPVLKDCYFEHRDGSPDKIKGKDVMMAPVANQKIIQDIIDSTEDEHLNIGQGDW